MSALLARVTPRVALTAGTLLVLAGVALHFPMYVSMAGMHYDMAGMAMSPGMVAGMALIVVGLVVAAVGLFVVRRPEEVAGRHAGPTAYTPTERLQPAHWRLVVALIFAVAIDAQKPYTFTFILPNVAHEYGLSTPAKHLAGAPSVALLPLGGIVGTVLGSFLWGIIGDRVGRRSALMFAAVLFLATSVCGFMPTFGSNVAMCFVMGLGAGGMLPAAFALLAETTPSRSRGWLLVLVAGVGTALGFVIASQLSEHVMPTYSWRSMWLAGIPTGVLLLGLARYIPESPRFLLLHGRTAEARRVLATFRAAPPELTPARPSEPTSMLGLFNKPFTGLTWGLVACAASVGVVTYGFLTWLPTNLTSHGLSAAHVNSLIADSALVALPVSLVVAWLYARWSARRTLIIAVAVTAAVLAVIALAGSGVASASGLLVTAVSLVLVGVWAVTAVITPYSTEIYPTSVRARGAALVAGATKVGGVVALAMSVTGIAPPGLSASAVLALLPIALGTAVLITSAIETRARSLESITLQTSRLSEGR